MSRTAHDIASMVERIVGQELADFDVAASLTDDLYMLPSTRLDEFCARIADRILEETGLGKER